MELKVEREEGLLLVTNPQEILAREPIVQVPRMNPAVPVPPRLPPRTSTELYRHHRDLHKSNNLALMIYRPTPISEAKAAALDDRLRVAIHKERTSTGSGLAVSLDPAFVPAHGRYEAIKRRVLYLQKLQAKLKTQLGHSVSPSNNTNEATSPDRVSTTKDHRPDVDDLDVRPVNEVIDPES